VCGEVGVEHAGKGLLGGAGRRAVVVGEIEVREAEVEGPEKERAGVGLIVVGAEVVPEPEGEGGELEAAAAAVAVERGIVVAGGGGLVRHDGRSDGLLRRYAPRNDKDEMRPRVVALPAQTKTPPAVRRGFSKLTVYVGRFRR
jgi:hypothetical protein